MKKRFDVKSVLTRVIVFFIVAVLVAIVLFGGYFHFMGRMYYAASEYGFRIPGLMQGYVPQSMAYVPGESVFLLSGYMKDHTSPSRVYIVDPKTDTCRASVVLGDGEGTPVVTHCGGMAYHEGLVYISGEDAECLRVYALKDILSAADGATVSAIGALPLRAGEDCIKSSFVCASEEGVIVGEFYKPENYPTAESHWVTTADGMNRALAVLYPWSEDTLGIAETPVRAYSLPDMVQGMVFDGEDMYLTQSYALGMSTIPRYRGYAEEGTIDALGVTLPLVTLTDACKASSVTAAPMAEQPVIVDGKFYIHCESASLQYLFGRLIGGQNVIATDMAYMRGE